MKRQKLKAAAEIGMMAVVALSLITSCGINDKGAAPAVQKKEITVTLLDGEHYSVSGAHKTAVLIGDDAEFVVELERGYRISGAFGDECEYTEDLSFTQTVVFTDMKYKSTVQLETEAMETTPFTVSSNGGGSVSVSSYLGEASDGVYYAEDIIELSVDAEEGYRFKCWSTGNYLAAGGKFYSYDRQLVSTETDFIAEEKLYANFSNTSNTAYTIIYDMGYGEEIEQDCYSMIEHHARANTLTAKNLEDGEYFEGDYVYDDGGRMLVGWETDEGEYVGLGSRVEVSSAGYIMLHAVWRDYTDEAKFTAENGVITSYTDNGESEVVIPKEIEGEEVTGIAAEAFAGSGANTYYIPDSVTSVAENAFHGCTALTDLYMSDNITTISDSSFTGCKNFTTLHLNAYLKPRYMKTYYNAKLEVYERLILNNTMHKVAVLGGSSVRYGYNTALSTQLMKEAEYDDYAVYNFGIDYGIGGLLQSEIIGRYLLGDDIFLHAPEVSQRPWIGSEEKSVIVDDYAFKICDAEHLAYPFYVFEADYGLLSNLTVKYYSDIFGELAIFNGYRENLNELSYVEFSSDLNEDGDTIVNQTNDTNKIFSSPIYVAFSNVNEATIVYASRYIYQNLIARGINVFVTYASINVNRLNYIYGAGNVQSEADKYTQLVQSTLYGTGVTVLLTQNDTIYGGECFADSDYHLGYPTRDTHTTKVINALISALNGE